MNKLFNKTIWRNINRLGCLIDGLIKYHNRGKEFGIEMDKHDAI